jgi:hypothetical protein
MMGFNKEITDFANAAFKTYSLLEKSDDSRVKNKYYEAMTKQAAAHAKYFEAAAGAKGSGKGGGLTAYQSASLGLRKRALDISERREANKPQKPLSTEELIEQTEKTGAVPAAPAATGKRSEADTDTEQSPFDVASGAGDEGYEEAATGGAGYSGYAGDPNLAANYAEPEGEPEERTSDLGPENQTFAASGGAIGHYDTAGPVDDAPQQGAVPVSDRINQDVSDLRGSTVTNMNRPLAQHGATRGIGLAPPPGLKPRYDLDPEAPTPAVGGPPPQQAPQQPAKSDTQSSMGFNLLKVMQEWHDAEKNPVAAGLDYLQKQHTGGTGFDTQRAADALHKGTGAATGPQMTLLQNAGDPKDELTAASKHIAAMDMVYKSLVANGNPNKAAEVAAGLLQYANLNARKYGEKAADLIHKGDLQGGAAMIMQAYDNVPDGKKLDIVQGPDGKLHAQSRDLTDPNGAPQDLGAFDGPQALKYAMKVANGSEYWSRVSAVANKDPTGAKAQKAELAQQKAAGVGQGGMKVTEFTHAGQSVGQAFDTFAEESKIQLDPGTARPLKNTAVHIFTDPTNRKSNLTEGEAAEAAMRLALPNPANPKEEGFTTKMTDKGAQVKFSNGTSAFVPKDQFDQLMTLRAQKLDAMKPPPAGQLNWVGRKLQNVDQFIGGAGKAIREGYQAMPPARPSGGDITDTAGLPGYP